MTTRDKIFWLLWVIIALAAILFTVKASGRSYPTQGSGAHDLISFSRAISMYMAEPSVVVTSSFKKFYFAVVATNEVGQSEYSDELVYTRTNSVTFVTLKWDSPVSNHVSGYYRYWGKSSGLYTNKEYCGTNLTTTVRIIPEMPSNLVVNVTLSNSTDMVWSTSPNGPWSKTGFSTYTTTNPMGPRYFRASSSKPKSKVFINSKMQ